MLTKSDLQAIKEIVDERLDSKLEEKLDKKLKSIKLDVKHIRKTVDVIITSFDRRTIHLEKRVNKIEQHLGFPQT